MVIFLLVRLGDVDPVSVVLGGKQSSPQTIENVRREFGLDKSIPEQYINWVKGLLHGEFGKSFKYRQESGQIIFARLPVTLSIVTIAALIAILLSIPAGILMAAKQHKWQDTGISVVQLILVACPPFLTATLMVWMLYLFSPQTAFTGSPRTFSELMERTFLPGVAMSFVMIALLSRIMKSGMTAELKSDYFLAAKAKGLSTAAVMRRHCLRNAIIPVITSLGMMIGILLVESVLVEEVFSLNGLGVALVEAVGASDYPLVQGITMFMVFVFMTISTLLDLLYGVIDPRIRKGKAI
jgi:peptide/nickel transport system permease protein